jgi:serine/threonine protein kinase
VLKNTAEDYSAYSKTSDVWSLGVMLCELLYGCLPYTGASPVVQYNKQKAG